MMAETTPAPTVRPPSADRKAQPLVHRYRRDQVDHHRHIVPRHYHLNPGRQINYPGHGRVVRKLELWTVAVEEWRVPDHLLPFVRTYALGLEILVCA